jgi:hypothetical protein
MVRGVGRVGGNEKVYEDVRKGEKSLGMLEMLRGVGRRLEVVKRLGKMLEMVSRV